MEEQRAWDTALQPPVVAAGLARILIVDDELSMRQMLSIALRREGYKVTAVPDAPSARAAVDSGDVDIVITDVRMPEVTGVELLRDLKGLDPSISVIMMTAFGSKETVLEALRLGANDYVEKTHNLKDELSLRIRKELDRKRLQQENTLLKRTLQSSHQFENIIGTSDAMQAVFRLVEAIAPTSSTVLITGESGTGKELVARAIHFNSPRKDRPFVALNCGALSETLLDSELFGHVRGAFTGADSNKKGLIEVAEKGTIFLDELGEMSPQVQVKLLRVLQERRFRRLGGTDEVDADIRIIAATNSDLSKMVEAGKFRQDLYYRVNVINVHMPPLRDRRDDIALLAASFVSRFARQMEKPIDGISDAAMAMLRRYHWPGNIRELENAMERAVALERTSVISPASLALAGAKAPEPDDTPGGGTEGDRLPLGFHLEQHVQEIEREYIAEALRRAGGVKVRAAELLGMSFRSFRYYTKKYNLK